MSVMPDLLAPTLAGPYKQISGMPNFGFQTPVSAADLARQRKNQKIDQKRRAGTQALAQMPGTAALLKQSQPVAPFPTTTRVQGARALAQPQAPTAPVDPYVQSMQAAVKAQQALLSSPYQPAQYKPPPRGLEYLAAGLSLLFPGSPIAYAASGLMQGLNQGAEASYQRREQQAEQQQTALERTASVTATMADAQGAIQARLDAIKERQAEYAQRHADAMSALQEKTREFNDMLPIRSAQSRALINHYADEDANAASRNAITQSDAELHASTTLQIEAFREAAMDARHSQDVSVRTAAIRLGALRDQTQGKIRALTSAVTADPTQAATAQATAAQIIANEQNQAQKIIGGVTSGRPDLQKISDVAVPLPLPTATQTPTAPGYEQPNQGYQLPPSPWGTPTNQPAQQTPSLEQVRSDEERPPEPFPGHPNLGKGKGIAQAPFEAALQHYSHTAFPSSDALLHDIAISPHAEDLSEGQIKQLMASFSTASKNPIRPAANTIPKTHAKPAELSEADQQVVDTRTKVWESQGYSPQIARQKAMAEVRASNAPSPATPIQTLSNRVSTILRVMRGQPADRIAAALEQIGIDAPRAQRLAQSVAARAPVAGRLGGSNATNPFELVQFNDSVSREDMPTTDPRLQAGLGYVLGPFAPDVTSVRHGKHAQDSAHYAGKAVDVGAFNGVEVGRNDETWNAVMTAIASRVFSKIGTIADLVDNPAAQAFAQAHRVKLFLDIGSGPHVHFQVP